jgi:hypothetical protein
MSKLEESDDASSLKEMIKKSFPRCSERGPSFHMFPGHFICPKEKPVDSENDE